PAAHDLFMSHRRKVIPPGSRIRYRDLEALGESLDGKRYELIEGALYVTPSPTTIHQRILRNLLVALHPFVKQHGLGEVFSAPTDVIFCEETVLIPDLLFVSKRNSERISTRGIEGAPDLVVEILSPKTASRDLEIKKETYPQHGVSEYWVVDPDAQTVERFEL